MIILNEREMWQAVTLEDVMGAIEKAFDMHRRGDYLMPDRFIAQKEKDMMLYMPCFSSEYVGTKMLAEFPENPKKGLPYLTHREQEIPDLYRWGDELWDSRCIFFCFGV